MSLNTEDRFYKEVFVDEIYKPILGEKCDVVIDAGALAGEFSLWIYDKAKQVYAIEPNNEHFAELKENIKDYPNIQAFNIALDNKNGEGLLTDGGRGGHTLSEATGQKVSIKTLATFLKENKIEHVDVLKVDIEGREDQVFASDDFLEVQDKISLIIGEHLAGSDPLLQKLGFKFERHGDNVVYKK